MFIKLLHSKIMTRPLLLVLFGLALFQTGVATAANAPAPAPALAIQHWTTANGAQVYFVPLNRLPILDVMVAFDAGSRRDGTQSGLANLTQSLLNDGTDTLTANQLADGFDKLGATLQGNTSQDMSTIALRTLTKPDILNPAIALFNQVVAKPNFPQNAVAREKNSAIKNIQITNQDPDQVASNAFFKALYDAYPYGSPTLGTIPGVSRISRDDVVNFYHHYYTGENATVALVGDITRQQAEEIANKVVGGLPKGQIAIKLPSLSQTATMSLHLNYPSTQTAIYLGQMGIRRGDPDYFPLMVANFVLGGDMSSRLFSIVREKYGLTYGIASSLYPLQDRGPFMINLLTRTDSSNQALALTRQITADFINKGITAQELQTAKQSLIGSFPMRIMTNNNLVNYLTVIGFYHLPLDYLNTFTSRIDAMTLNQVNSAVKQRLNPATFVTVTVGAMTKPSA